MSFIAPLWLAAAGLVAAGVVLAHLFATTIPPQDVLPTVRFIPESTPLTVVRTRRVSDVWLMLLRLLAMALFGLALAGAHVRRNAPRRVVIVDASRAVASPTSVVDSALALTMGEVIIFDSTARRATLDSLAVLRGRTTFARGSLSAGLVAAHRLVAARADGREETELVIVSPLVREEVDSATARLLSLWEGPVRVVRVPAAAASAASVAEVRTDGDDPVAAVTPSAAVIPSAARDPQSVRIVRTQPTAADSQWAHAGGALVIWPARDEAKVLAPRAPVDTQGGIATDRNVVVAPFARRFRPREGRAVVRWADGQPAATERVLGQGCVREVAIPVDAVGDVALRDSFRGVVRSLLEPCGGLRDVTPVVIPRSEATRNLKFTETQTADAGRLPLWLALMAVVALLAEQLLRARRVKPA